MRYMRLAILWGLTVARASVVPRQETSSSSTTSPHTYLVFGDSYSDECNAWRLEAAANISDLFPFPACPPPGDDYATRSTHGYIWPEILRNGSQVDVLNFAVSGATCSNSLYARNLTAANGTSIPLPAVDDQIQTFQQYNSTQAERSTDHTALIFIGTNDLGAYFSGFQYNAPVQEAPINVTIDDEATCVLRQAQLLLDMGVRRVIIMNTTPLQFAPLYSRDTVDGYGSVVTQNGALTSMLMKQLVFANNALQKQLVEPHATNANNSDSQGVIEIYDAYTLFENLLLNPPTSAYGPNPNTTSYCGDCPTGATCAPCPDPSPYFYADPLHPSQTTSELLAQDLANYLNLTFANPLSV